MRTAHCYGQRRNNPRPEPIEAHIAQCERTIARFKSEKKKAEMLGWAGTVKQSERMIEVFEKMREEMIKSQMVAR